MLNHRAELSAIVLLAFAASPGAARAASRHLETGATTLTVESPCARTVTIQPDSGLNGRVVVDAVADHEEELAQLVLSGDSPAKLRRAGRECWEPGQESDFEPTMSITIRMPQAMAVAIDESGGAEYTIGALQGPLTLDISGGVKLHAAQSAALAVDLSGGGTVAIGRVDGNAKAQLSGGGTIRIDQATLQDLALEVSGGGAFTLGDGTVARATVNISGAASVRVGGTTGDAAVDLSGAGSVRFAKVTGHLTKDVSGWGSVTVDTP